MDKIFTWPKLDRAIICVEALRKITDGSLHDALETAEKALRRVTPTRTTHQATIYKCNTCPNCLNVVDEFEEFIPGQRINTRPSYCKFCGQALLWE